MEECPTGFTQRWILEQGRSAVLRPAAMALVRGSPSYDPFECIRIPPVRSTGGIDLGPIGETALSIGLRAFDVGTFGLSSPLTSLVTSQSRTEDLYSPVLSRQLKSQEVPTMNGFSDIFGDIGAFFTTEQTLGETFLNVGSDIWGGVSNIGSMLLPSVALPIAQSFLPAAPRTGQPAPSRPSIPQLFLPEFLRSTGTQASPWPPGYGGTPGERQPGGGWPTGTWEADTYGEPFTFPAAGGGAGMMAMVPAVRGMGTLALQATVNAMRTQGLAASVGWLAGVIKKFGPAAAVGFLASWVADEIAQRAVWEAYSHKHRRMNPANVKALRRSLRRISSFDNLCKRVAKCKPRRVCR